MAIVCARFPAVGSVARRLASWETCARDVLPGPDGMPDARPGMATPERVLAVPPHRPRMLVTAEMGPEALDALRALGAVEYSSFREAMLLLAGPTLVEAGPTRRGLRRG